MKWLKKLFPKMYNDQMIERIMNYKNLYQGQRFQWVKNYPQGMAAAVVTVIDIEYTGGSIVCLFDNSHRVTVEQLNADFQMVTNDMPAMSLSEVLSINQDPGTLPTPEGVPESPLVSAPQVQSQPSTDLRTGLPISQVPPQFIQQQTQAPVQTVNPASIFGMFSLNPTKLKMDVEVKLPAMNLLKAMYTESQDKDEFLQKVSAYVLQNLTHDAVRDAVMNKLGPIKNQR